MHEKLRILFAGFEDADVKPLFILMGNFVSKSATSSNGRESAKNSLNLLEEAITSSPRIAKEAKFLIIPGNLDPGISKFFPRAAIPDIFTGDLRKNVKNISFASNPCRLRYFTQEIVLFRQDLLKQMQRHVAVPPSTEESAPDVTEQLVVSLMEQAHLWPLPAHVKPVHWKLDHALRLSPLPHLVRNMR